jgi:hypothetical protein
MHIPRSLAILGSVVIMTLGGVLIAHAAIPSADGTFTACINKTSGAVRIIDAERTPPVNCASNEIRRTWSQGAPSTYATTSDGGEREADGTWVATALCDPGDQIEALFNWGMSNGPATRIEIGPDNISGRQGQTLRLDGPANVVGYVTTTCLDTAAPAHTP